MKALYYIFRYFKIGNIGDYHLQVLDISNTDGFSTMNGFSTEEDAEIYLARYLSKKEKKYTDYYMIQKMYNKI